jgi:hypothetical protein
MSFHRGIGAMTLRKTDGVAIDDQLVSILWN